MTWDSCPLPPLMNTEWERQADFVTGEEVAGGGSAVQRPDAVVLDRRTAYTLGPDTFGDATFGVEVRVWRARYAAGEVYLARWVDGVGWDEAPRFAVPGAPVDELSVAFDQSGGVVIAAERGGHVWVHFFDPLASAYVFTDMGAGRSPVAVLDDLDASQGDVQVFYIDAAGTLYHRQERDRYGIAYSAGFTGDAYTRVETAARTQTGRLAVVLSHRDLSAGRYALSRVESTLFPYHARESVALSGDVVSGLLRDMLPGFLECVQLGGAPLAGVLSSTTLVFPWLESVRLSGGPTSGTLASTTVSTSQREDVRLSGAPQGGTLVAVIVSYAWREDVSLSGFPTGGVLA